MAIPLPTISETLTRRLTTLLTLSAWPYFRVRVDFMLAEGLERTLVETGPMTMPCFSEKVLTSEVLSF
jgi:hypothetical protein